MTKRKLAAAIALREGKKSQARIGDIMEVLTVMEQLMAEARANKAFKEGATYFTELPCDTEENISTRVQTLALKHLRQMNTVKS